jgi:hypothetical protein
MIIRRRRRIGRRGRIWEGVRGRKICTPTRG